MGLSCLWNKSMGMRSLTFRPILLLQPRYFTSIPSSLTQQPDSAVKHLNDEDNKAVGITVWWDFENCHIPTEVSAYKVEGRITSALRASGIKGPVTITAFGNVSELSPATCCALCTTGISLRHVPNSGKNSADKFIMADLVYWVAKNHPPAHFFLITGDRDFASILHRLRMSNYNVLLASRSFGSTALYSAATIVWNWDTLVKGESLVGKHFNYPPDGRYGSWYAHSNASTEGTQMNSDFIRSQPVVEESGKLNYDSYSNRSLPIPKELARRMISQILTSNPKGISINNLSKELHKKQIILDKNHYGYKKLSSLVSSLSDIAIVKPHNGLKYDLMAYPVYKESDHPSPIPDLDDTAYHDEKQLTEPEEESVMLAGESSSLVDETNGTIQVDVLDSNKNNEYDVSMKDGDGVHEPVEKDDTSKQGFFQRIWEKWARVISFPTRKVIDRNSPMDNSGKNDNIEQMPFANDRNSKESEKIQPEGEPDPHHVDSASANKTFSQKSDILQNIHCNDANNSISTESPHYLFSKKDFWNSLEAFLSTPEGLELVSTSTSRNHLIRRLSAQGLLLHNSLTYSDISHLVDLLISDNWVDECRHKAFPFKLKKSVDRSHASSYDHGSEELDGIFSSRQSLSQVSHGFENPVSERGQRPPETLVQLKAWYCKTFKGNVITKASDLNACFVEQFGNKIDVSSYGHSNIEDLLETCSTNFWNQEENERRRCQMSQHKILSDCQKLVEDCLRERPSGVLLTALKSLFYQKYGYNLDYQRLGYVKLSHMLKIFPGMEVKSNWVVPDLAKLKLAVTETLNSDTGTKKYVDTSTHMEDDSWDELGPLTETRLLENKRKKEELVKSAVSETLNSGTINKKDVNVSALIEVDSWEELGPLIETFMLEKKIKNKEQVESEEIDFSGEEEFRGSETTHRSIKTGERKIQGPLTEIQMLENKRKNENKVELEEIEFSDEESTGSEIHRLTKKGETKIQRKSSLVEILESWNNTKEDEKKMSQANEEFIDCSGRSSLLPADSMPSNTLKTLKPKTSMKDKFISYSNLKTKLVMEDSFVSYSNSSDETTKLTDDVFQWLTQGNLSEQKEK